jgi:tetratricopeptide (TPR) repeat protein
MPRLLGNVLRFPLHTARAARKCPRLAALLVALLLITSAAAGLWGYAVYQWRAAQAAIKADRPAEARERLNRCLRVWPRNPEVHFLAARAARLTGDFVATEAHLNRCIELQNGATEPVQFEFLLMRVQAGEIDDNRGPISVLFNAVQNGYPEPDVILDTIARTYLLRLRYRPAFECLNYWIELQPENPKPYHLRGWTQERINNPKAAKADYERALELNPDMALARLGLAEMLLHDKQAPDALPHLERLHRQSPDDPRVQARMGICLFLQGRAEEARRLMEAAVTGLPNDSPLLIALANLNLQDGRGAEAELWARKVIADDPADTEALFVLISALQLQGRVEDATALLAELERKRVIVDRINALLRDVADSPNAKADDYAELARFLFQIGRDKLGVYWGERALERDSTNQPAHRALAEYYERTGVPLKAAVHRRQIREAPSPLSDPAVKRP